MDYSKLKVPELKKLLKEKHLPTTGNKQELYDRLTNNQICSTSAEEVDDSVNLDEMENKDESELLGEADLDDDDLPAEEDEKQLLTDFPLIASSQSLTGGQKQQLSAAKSSTISATITGTSDTSSTVVSSALSVSADTHGTTVAAAGGEGGVQRVSEKRSQLERLTPEQRRQYRMEKFHTHSAVSGGAGGDQTGGGKQRRILTAEERRWKYSQEAGAGTSVTAAVAGTGSRGAQMKEADEQDLVEKLKRRAQRFGESVSSRIDQIDQVERLKRRRERFNLDAVSNTDSKNAIGQSINSMNQSDELKKAQRAKRFGLVN